MFSLAVTGATSVSAQPVFVNGLVIPGNRLDATRQPGANGGRLGFFSDIYYDPSTDEWWALSDRGPGGGLSLRNARPALLDRHQPLHRRASRTSASLETVKFTDPKGLLSGDGKAMNGLNPLDFNGFERILGRSFDPEGLVIDPRTGNFLVADEYGPSLYAFDKKGRLVKVFETPDNLVPKAAGAVNYVALRDACGGSVPCRCAAPTTAARTTAVTKGLAVSPDGTRLFAVLQDPSSTSRRPTTAAPGATSGSSCSTTTGTAGTTA